MNATKLFLTSLSLLLSIWNMWILYSYTYIKALLSQFPTISLMINKEVAFIQLRMVNEREFKTHFTPIDCYRYLAELYDHWDQVFFCCFVRFIKLGLYNRVYIDTFTSVCIQFTFKCKTGMNWFVLPRNCGTNFISERGFQMELISVESIITEIHIWLASWLWVTMINSWINNRMISNPFVIVLITIETVIIGYHYLCLLHFFFF